MKRKPLSIRLVTPVGSLAAKFKAGTLLLGKRIILPDENPVLIWNTTPFWEEVRTDAIPPRRWPSEEMARKAGMRTHWGAYGTPEARPTVMPGMDVDLYLASPDYKWTRTFKVLVGGIWYARVHLKLSKKSYEHVQSTMSGALAKYADGSTMPWWILRSIPYSSGPYNTFLYEITCGGKLGGAARRDVKDLKEDPT